jgi:hypothetical protein
MDEGNTAPEREDLDEPAAARVADRLAASRGTPDWRALKAAAESLAAKFVLPDAASLAVALVEGMAKSGVEQGELVLARIDGRGMLLDQEDCDNLEEVLGTAGELLSLLQKARAPLDPALTEVLEEVLEAFLTRHAAEDYLVPNVGPDGRRNPPPMPARAFLITLAQEWREQTGERATAYKDPVTGRPAGRFWPFAVAACEAVGLRPPSVQSLENWLKPDHPRNVRSARELLVKTQQNGPEG